MQHNPTPAQGAGHGTPTTPGAEAAFVLPDYPIELGRVFSLRWPAPVRAAGVYRLYRKDTVIYVGSSHNILLRLLQHQSKGRIPFDSFDFTQVEDEDERLLTEIKFIHHHAPEFNTRELPYRLPEIISWKMLIKRMPPRWGPVRTLRLARALGIDLDVGDQMHRDTALQIINTANNPVSA